MKSNKEYRWQSNPLEKKFHDKFKEWFGKNKADTNRLSAVIFGWMNDAQTIPNEYLTFYEEDICISVIQWLGSPIGQNFLAEVGFKYIGDEKM